MSTGFQIGKDAYRQGRYIKNWFLWCTWTPNSVGNEGMTLVNHALWFPLRESLGSFPHSLLIAPIARSFVCCSFGLFSHARSNRRSDPLCRWPPPTAPSTCSQCSPGPLPSEPPGPGFVQFDNPNYLAEGRWGLPYNSICSVFRTRRNSTLLQSPLLKGMWVHSQVKLNTPYLETASCEA